MMNFWLSIGRNNRVTIECDGYTLINIGDTGLIKFRNLPDKFDTDSSGKLITIGVDLV